MSEICYGRPLQAWLLPDLNIIPDSCFWENYLLMTNKTPYWMSIVHITARAMKTDGIVLTDAPGLPFKHIIHVVAQESIRAWRKMVDKCFKMAEEKQLNSIAFPALGTSKFILIV